MAPSMEINSNEFFKINRTCWKLLGLGMLMVEGHKTNGQRKMSTNLYMVWAIVINLMATCCFPIHLFLGIFESENKTSFFDSISITITSIGASTKLLIIAIKMKKILEMQSLLRTLDARITHHEEVRHFRQDIRSRIMNIQRLYFVVYCGVGISVLGAFLFSKEQRLFYSGWFPFDWRSSLGNYAAAISYQCIPIFFQMMQTFCNDSFSPIALCVLSAHIELLYMRVVRIGQDKNGKMRETTTLQEDEEELNRCVLDQMNLYELYNTMQNIISWAMFIQFFVSVVNNCVAIVALLFFVTDVFERIYYVIYILAMGIQLFPTCYYGSDFVLLFEKLHYAVFSCNWIGQSKSFKRHMMIFTERSLRETVALAGGIFPIHLDTFFGTCKATYSLFAVVMTMK
ncbi:odorant receptor 59a [Musca domestica]|uniref:Odorant receptor n=1 Tax=Musca domestica TaxID=7370 RepID=A0A1I8MM17_MUSDO|nr:odorant receptor 59a [Musca domestica]